MQIADIFELVERMATLIRSEERKKCSKLRLQLVHFEVLDYLSKSNQFSDTPAATAAYFGMTRGTVSQSLIILEKKGYIEKNKDETDKRIVHVHILPPGLAILKKARRTELFKKATSILQNNASQPIPVNHFITVFQALQTATDSLAFKTGINKESNRLIKKANIFEIIGRMAALIRAEERRKCTQLKIQMVHYQVLDYLSRCNKYSDSAASISNYLGMTRGTVSQTLIILETRGFIKKQQDPSDKRVFHIQLLAKGVSILSKTKPTEMFKKATITLESDTNFVGEKDVFSNALTALQKANNSNYFGVCKTCHYFTSQSSGFFCALTQEQLYRHESELICQEHTPV